MAKAFLSDLLPLEYNTIDQFLIGLKIRLNNKNISTNNYMERKVLHESTSGVDESTIELES